MKKYTVLALLFFCSTQTFASHSWLVSKQKQWRYTNNTPFTQVITVSVDVFAKRSFPSPQPVTLSCGKKEVSMLSGEGTSCELAPYTSSLIYLTETDGIRVLSHGKYSIETLR